jgi:3'-phosphoadenosine 5'-phosphosulfate sulfotransferase (PAPS reductase)/FAD synthetase
MFQVTVFERPAPAGTPERGAAESVLGRARAERDVAGLVDGLNFRQKVDRSLGCRPCTRITTDPNERAGRWIGTSKCGGECGIHTQPLRRVDGAGI